MSEPARQGGGGGADFSSMHLLVLDEAWQAVGGVDTVRRALLPALAAKVRKLWWASPTRLHARRLENLDLRGIEVIDTLPGGTAPEGWLLAALRRWPARPVAAGRERLETALVHSHLRRLCRKLGVTHACEICVLRRRFPRLGVPTAGIVHDLDYPQRGASPIDRIFLDWLEHARCLLAGSRQTEAELRSLGPRLHPGITHSPLPPPARPAAAPVRVQNPWRRPEPVLFYPATALARKGHAVLLAALAQLAAESRPFHLYLTGGGTDALLRDKPAADPDLEAWRQTCRPFLPALGGRITALGWQDWQVVEEIYAACDLVVIPSLYEGFGFPLVEALLRERPLIATRLPPAMEQVEFYQAAAQVQWVDPGDPTGLATALRTWLAQASSSPPFTPAVRERLAAWTWAAYAERLLSALTEPRRGARVEG